MSDADTQARKILAHLRHGPITARQAAVKFDCYRLAARIHDLRRAGHVITTTWVHGGPRVRFASYSLGRPGADNRPAQP